MAHSEAEDALLAFAADLVREIATGQALELSNAATQAELRRRESVQRDALPDESSPLVYSPWAHTLQNPQNRTHLLGYQLQQLQAAQRRGALSAADALGAKVASGLSAPSGSPERGATATGIPPVDQNFAVIDSLPAGQGQAQPVTGPKPRHRPRPQPTRYRTRRLRRAPGWVSDKGQHGGYGGSTGGGGTGGD